MVPFPEATKINGGALVVKLSGRVSGYKILNVYSAELVRIPGYLVE